MSIEDAITEWIVQLKEGDTEAAEKLWQRYFAEIVNQSRRKLEGAVRAVADEEDVALSAFKSVCVGARQGRFPRLSDRDSLWSLLVAITAHKSVDLIRHENRRKRGGDSSSDTAASQPRLSHDYASLSSITEREPSPEFAAQIGEQFEILMKKLQDADDPELMEIAISRMQGATTTEIALQLGCVKRTVERKTRLIRSIWEKVCD